MRQYCQSQIEKNRNEEDKRNAKRAEALKVETPVEPQPVIPTTNDTDVEMKEQKEEQ